ncbi:hypothetical protein FRC08_009594 [Ceratobasidium sp. 394]|nr:hypothetical protein FRC08_009594 [Ceratobasidium sp. 394]
MSFVPSDFHFKPFKDTPGVIYVAYGAAADIWKLPPTDLPPSVQKVIRVSPKSLDQSFLGDGSQSSTSLWKDFMQDYRTKIKAWSGLDHPNVVRVFGFGDGLNLQVAFYEKGCARDYIKSHSSVADKIAMVLDVLAGMKYLHEHDPPIIHGSLNAGKLFVDQNGKTLIGEFGLAALCYPFAAYVPSISFADLNRWLSPELFNNNKDGTIRPTIASDIWALGSTLFEIVTETLPYSNHKHPITVQRAIMARQPPGRREDILRTSDFGFICPIIEACWAQAPEDRPSVSKLAEVFNEVVLQDHSATSAEIFVEDRLAIASSGDTTTWTGDARTNFALIDSLRDHSDWVTSVAISSNGRRIVSGSWDKSVLTQTESAPVLGHLDAVTSVAIFSDGRRIVSGSYDEAVRVWDADTGFTLLEPMRGHLDWVTSVAISSDDQYIVSGSWDETVRIWDVQTGNALLGPLKGHSGGVTCVAIARNCRWIASGSNDTDIRIWDARTGNALFSPFRGHSGPVNCVAITPDDQCIVSGSDDRTVRVWDAYSGVTRFEPLRGHLGSVTCVAISSDGRRIVSGSEDMKIRIWDGQNGVALFNPLRGHTGRVTSVAITPNGQCIVSASRDKTVRIWGAEIGLLQDPLDQASSSRETPLKYRYDTGTSEHTRNPILPPPFGKPGSTGDVKNSAHQIEVALRSDMSVSDIIASLGFRNISDELDLASCSTFAVFGGGIHDVFSGMTHDGTKVAIKIIRVSIEDSEVETRYSTTRMACEFHAWSRCEHPNVARLLGLAEFRGQIATVSLWMENGNLPSHVRSYPDVDRFKLVCGPLPVLKVLICKVFLPRQCVQAANGVKYLHSIGIIHNGLKGSNVLISGEGTAVINGFGIAVSIESALLIEEPARCPIQWLAPELFEDDDKPGSRESDVYALGMTILEAFTGDVPYPGRTMPRVLYHVAIQKEKPARPLQHIPADNDWGDALWDLLMRCWSLEPLERPTAAEVRDRLRAISAVYHVSLQQHRSLQHPI